MIGVSAAAGLGGAAMASSASKKAAQAQVDSTKTAAQLQKQASDAALAETKRQFDVGQANQQPWLQAGTFGLNALLYGLGLPQTPAPAISATSYPLSPAMEWASIPQSPEATGLAQRIAQLEAQREGIVNQAAQSGFMPTGSTMNPISAELNAIDEQIRQLNEQYKVSASEWHSQVTQAAGQVPTPSQGSVQTGETSINPISNSGLGFGDLMKTFDPSTVSVDPGFDFRLQEGQKALERSAAAKGSGLGGGTLKALADYSQGLASQEYDRAYTRQFNTFQTDQANRYNRLASISGVGQVAANQMNQAGQNYAANVGNIQMGTAAQLGDLATQAANARASGIVGSANAWASGIGNAGNNIMSAYMLNQTLKGGTA